MHPLPKRPRKQKNWTDYELFIIRDASRSGLDIKWVMKSIQRSKGTIKSKASQIGYPLLEETQKLKAN